MSEVDKLLTSIADYYRFASTSNNTPVLDLITKGLEDLIFTLDETYCNLIDEELIELDSTLHIPVDGGFVFEYPMTKENDGFLANGLIVNGLCAPSPDANIDDGSLELNTFAVLPDIFKEDEESSDSLCPVVGIQVPNGTILLNNGIAITLLTASKNYDDPDNVKEVPVWRSEPKCWYISVPVTDPTNGDIKLSGSDFSGPFDLRLDTENKIITLDYPMYFSSNHDDYFKYDEYDIDDTSGDIMDVLSQIWRKLQPELAEGLLPYTVE